MNDKLRLCAICHFGLESETSYELKALGLDGVSASDGRVFFDGNLSGAAKANIALRTAERVYIVLAEFKATTFTELFDNTAKIPFENFIGSTDAFPVKGKSVRSKLFSVPDCQSIVKKAAVSRLSGVYKKSWFEESGSVHQIAFFILKDVCHIMLDTTGAPLHKRGYRPESTEAPISETLAAGILSLARVKSNSTLYDPFCGSGTFLIEGALRAMNIAPGLGRHFSADSWSSEWAALFKTEKSAAHERINRDAEYTAYGYDADKSAVDLTLENARRAGVVSRLSVSAADIKDFSPKAERAIVVANPPYGERLLDLTGARNIYRTMGEVFIKRQGYSYFIITDDEEFETFFGRNADKTRKLRNGKLNCRLYEYFRS